MKHEDFYDKHADHRKGSSKKKKINENRDREARHARVTFKNYLRQLDEELNEMEDDDYLDADTQE